MGIDYIYPVIKTREMTDRQKADEIYAAAIEAIESALKATRQKYTIDKDLGTTNFDILIGSHKVYVQIEAGSDTNPSGVAQFYDDPEGGRFDETEDIQHVYWDPSDKLGELMQFAKTKVKAEAKIEALLERIYDVCQDADLDIEDYIKVVSDNIETSF